MPVLLPNGMVFETTARSLMRAASAWMRSGESNVTPAGATVNCSSVGWAEWHARQRRCLPCHSAHPTDDQFTVAPAGVMFDSPERIQALAARVKERAVVSKTMPFGNKTGMTDDERALLGAWIDQGAKIK